MTPLHEHVATEHEHGADYLYVLTSTTESVRAWHEWDHHPRLNAKHAHDEFTARRKGVPLHPAVDAASPEHFDERGAP